MEFSDSDSEELGKRTAEVSLDVSAEIAEEAEKMLSDFAEDAGLETALIVDRGGALVAGISSEEDVAVDVISDLVAGASSAMRALVDQLGETGEIESLHQGGDRLLYIREVIARFILVGVSDASLPPGIVREKAAQLQPVLADLLRDVKPLETPPPEPAERPKSLRAVAAERAAARVKVELERIDPEVKESETDDIFEAVEDLGDETSEEPEAGEGEGAADIFEPDSIEETEEETVSAEEEKLEREPIEVLEPIDLGEPEIVIEGVTKEPVPAEESPFEFEAEEEPESEETEEPKEDNAEAEPEATESIFELENDPDDTDEESDPEETESIFEWDGDGEDEEEKKESETPGADLVTSDESEDTPGAVFEFDEETDADEEEEDEFVAESPEPRPEEPDEEESETRSAGPLYF